MKERHRRFEMQCVLASCGQLSSRQLEQLLEHAAICEACEKRLREMEAVHLHLLAAMPEQCKSSPDSKSMTERFVARAIRQGVPLGERPISGAPMQLALGLSAVMLLAAVTAVLTWHPREGVSHETGIASATQGLAPQSPLMVGGSRSGDTSRKSLRRPARRTAMRESSSAQSRNEPVGHVQRYPFELFREYDRPTSTAWQAHRNAAPAFPSLTPHRECGIRDESSSGDQPWSAWGRKNASGPPVFCYDPRFALVAESKLPEPIRRWDRTSEFDSLPPFHINSGRPLIIH